MYRHIVFDMDGTLVNTADVLCASLGEAMESKEGRALDPIQFYHIFGRPTEETLDALKLQHREAVKKRWWENYAQHISEVGLFSDVQ